MSNNLSCGDPANFIAGQGLVMSSNVSWAKLELDLPNNNDFNKLQERMSAIEKRLAILQPNEDLQAKYPALQEAYDHYKLIEKLVEGKSGNGT
jgi:hypothetical protein